MCLVAFYVLLLFVMLWSWARVGFVTTMKRHFDLGVLPVVTFVLQKVLCPTKNEFSTYNAFKLSWGVIRIGVRSFDITVLGGIGRAVQEPLAVLVGGALIAVGIAAWPLRDGRSAPRRAALVAAFTLLWVVAAVLPYALVGKAPSGSQVWKWRHGLLVALTPGFAFLALAFLVRGTLAGRALLAAVAGSLLAGQACDAADVHAQWLARAAKQRAVVEQARASPLMPRPEVVWFDDQLPAANGVPMISYEYTGWTAAILDGLYAGGFRALMKGDVPAKNIAYFWYYLLPRFRGDGPHALLTIRSRIGPVKPHELSAQGRAYAWARLRGAGSEYASSIVEATLASTAPPPDWDAKMKAARRLQRKRAPRPSRADALQPIEPAVEGSTLAAPNREPAREDMTFEGGTRGDDDDDGVARAVPPEDAPTD